MDLGQIIAQRTLECRDANIPVVVSIGMPVAVDEGANYFCPFAITGLSRAHKGRAGGVDGVQALILALQLAATHLYTSDEWKSGRLLYLGERDLGLPVPESIRDIPPRRR